MTLAFMTKLNGEPTHFVDKILASFYDDIQVQEYYYENRDKIKPYIIPERCFTPKLHTIRDDKNHRWKAGNDIHFVINNHQKNRLQFLPIVKCISTQSIEFRYPLSSRFPIILIDGKRITIQAEDALAINDGFKSYTNFITYFNENFTGTLIHWTALKY